MKGLFLALFTQNFITHYRSSFQLQKFPWIQKDHKQIQKGKPSRSANPKDKISVSGSASTIDSRRKKVSWEVSLEEKGRHTLFLWLLLFVAGYCMNWTFHLTQCSHAFLFNQRPECRWSYLINISNKIQVTNKIQTLYLPV